MAQPVTKSDDAATLYFGEVMHARLKPMGHRFGYRVMSLLIDLDRLGLKAPEMVRDLPDGGKRLLQRTTGYVATIVSGKVVSREGEPTSELSGRVVRRMVPPS